MGRHAAGGRAGSASAPSRPRRSRPAGGLLGWGVFTALVTAGALLVHGVPVPTSAAVGLLGLVVFAVVWAATWRAGSTPPRRVPGPEPAAHDD